MYCQCNRKNCQKKVLKKGKLYAKGHNPNSVHFKKRRYKVCDMGYKTRCWIWQLHIGTSGYGIVYVKVKGKRYRKQKQAHVWMYEKKVGKVPKGKELDHLCRIRSCIRSSHMEPVTRQKNVHRGLSVKLTERQVASMRRLYTMGYYIQKELAKRYGISQTQVSDIVHRKWWHTSRDRREETV